MPLINRATIFKLNADRSYENMPAHIRDKVELSIKEDDSLKDVRKRILKGFITFEVKYKDYSILRPLLPMAISKAIDGAVEAEFVGQSTGTNSYDAVFQFFSPNVIGYGFEYVETEKERYIEHHLIVKLPWKKGKSLIDASQTNTPVVATGLQMNDPSLALASYPNLKSVTIGGIALYSPMDLKSYKFSIKTVGVKNIYEMERATDLEISLECEIADVPIAKAKQLLELQSSEVVVTQENDSNIDEIKRFASGVLSKNVDAKLSDGEQSGKLKFTGSIALRKYSYTSGINTHLFAF